MHVGHNYSLKEVLNWTRKDIYHLFLIAVIPVIIYQVCLLYTSDAADERSSVDLGGRRSFKKKKKYTAVDDDRTTKKHTK